MEPISFQLTPAQSRAFLAALKTAVYLQLLQEGYLTAGQLALLREDR